MSVKEMMLDIIEKNPVLRQLTVVGLIVFGVVWVNQENLKAQAQLQQLLKTALEQQVLCEEDLLQLRKDIKALETEVHQLKLKASSNIINN